MFMENIKKEFPTDHLKLLQFQVERHIFAQLRIKSLKNSLFQNYVTYQNYLAPKRCQASIPNLKIACVHKALMQGSQIREPIVACQMHFCGPRTSLLLKNY